MALTRTLTLTSGSDSLPVVDYTEATDWVDTELGTSANRAEGADSTWTLFDDDGIIPDFVAPGQFTNAHNIVVGSIGSDVFFRGRVADVDRSRGRQRGTRPAELQVILEDNNAELRGMVVDGWIRPAETDAARIQALVAGYLSGNYRATTNLNGSNYVVTGSNTISLPAKTYTGVTPFEIAQEISANADKEVFVTIDNELAYFGHDYTGYASTLRISDDIADANSSTYAPIEPHGKEAGRTELTALRVYYQPGDGRTTQSSTRITNNLKTQTDFWEEAYWDSTSKTSAQAIAKAQKLLDYRGQNDVSYSCSIGPMPGEDVVKIKKGQTIQFKSRAARGGRSSAGAWSGDSFITVRIRELRWSMPAEDMYIAHLELERPKRLHPPSPGSQALTIMPTPAPIAVSDTVTGGSETARWSYTNFYPAGATGGNRDDTNTWGGGFQRHVAGSTGLQQLGLPDKWYDPADAALGGYYGQQDGSLSTGDYITAAASTTLYFSAVTFWLYAAGKSVLVEYWDASAQLGSDTVVDGTGRAIRTLYSDVKAFTTPVGTTRIRIKTSATPGSTLLLDNMVIGTPGSVTYASNDQYAVRDTSTSPYYARSDDPRFNFDTAVPSVDNTTASLTNNSGLDIAYGDIVTLDSSANDAFTVNTTLNNNTGWMGVAQEPIGSNSRGRVLLSGYTAVVNVGSNSTTRGSWLYGSNMARRAYGSNVRAAGAFGQVLTTSVVPDAIIWSKTDSASASTADAGAPGALGAWTAYTPTWTADGTAPAIGNGTLIGRYKKLDDNTYFVSICLTAGSTTTFGTLTWHFALPAAIKNTTGQQQSLSGYILDAGTDHKLAVGVINAGSAQISGVVVETANTISNTVPHTWAVNDVLQVQGFIEI